MEALFICWKQDLVIWGAWGLLEAIDYETVLSV